MLLGIDIGGTTINFGIVEGTGVVRKLCVPSFRKEASLQETLDWLISNTEEIILPEVSGIGIGVPTLVDPVKGIVYDACNIPSWKEVPLKDVMEARFGLPVAINNDSNCFALGAAALLGKKHSTLVGITLGTGTGMGIVSDGKLFTGANCGAGEVGSLPYLGKDFESFCSKKFFLDRGIEPKDAAVKAEGGDSEALGLFREFGSHMGELLAVVMYSYDPAAIVLGGGVAGGFQLFRESMMDTLRSRYIYPRFLEKVEITALTGEDVALVGASIL